MSTQACRAESLWATFVIENRGPETVTIKDVNLKFGKFCEGGLIPCKEIQPSDIDGQTIDSGKNYTIHTSGRLNSVSGTEGSFDLYAKDEKVATIYWDSPWGGRHNVVLVRDTSTEWLVSRSNFAPIGPIGNVIINLKAAYTG